MCFSARIVTENGIALLAFEGGTTVHTLPRGGMLYGFSGVPKERKIAATGGAIDFRLS
jgi:hypothetical protein